MATIYILSNDALSAHCPASTLETQLQELVDGRYPVDIVQDMAQLKQCLSDTRQAVVFLAAPLLQIKTIIQQCRDVLPATAFVVLSAETELSKATVFEHDCHFLSQPNAPLQCLTQLSAAIRQSELLSSLMEGSQRDEVANVFNRRYFHQRLSEEISLSKRHLSPLCCVILGINFYQIYLDSYGYEFINGLIRYTVEKVISLTRHEDIIARLGDDELAILLPRSTEKGAKVFTNRLVQALNACVFTIGEHQEMLSVSAGVAGFPLPDNSTATADTIIRYGRHALHQARCTDAEDTLPVCFFSEINPVL